MTTATAAAPPLFTVVVVDYEGSVPRDIFRRKIASLAAQTDPDFEVLVYHDGPKTTAYEDDVAGMVIPPATRFHITATRENQWGHPSRDRGIRAARGEWIIHTNADNVFYPNLIETLRRFAVPSEPAIDLTATVGFRADGSARYNRLRQALQTRTFARTLPDALVYAIILRGYIPWAGALRRVPDEGPENAVILSGFPVQLRSIDAMQFVMRRERWLAEDGWSDLSKYSDGPLYERFAQKYHVRSVPHILGEHW